MKKKVYRMGAAFGVAALLASVCAALVLGCGRGRDDDGPKPIVPEHPSLVYTSTLEQGGPGYVDIYREIEDPLAPGAAGVAPVLTAIKPAVIVLHGGAWRTGSRHDVADVANELAHEGFVAFAPDYSLAPGVQWPAPLLDLRKLVGFMRRNADNLGIDANKIGAWGVDAGGHLAAALALIDDPAATPPAPGRPSGGRIQCAVTVYGFSDLTIENGSFPDEDGVLRDFLGAPRIRLPLPRILDASMTIHVRPDASILLEHGSFDSLVSIRHSEHLYDALRGAGADTEFVRVTGGRHDASTYRAPEAWAATAQFLKLRVNRSF